MRRHENTTSRTTRTDCCTVAWLLLTLSLVLAACVGEEPAQQGDTQGPQDTGSDAVCVPQCDGKQCGDDGCGGQCRPGCLAGQICNAATWECVCIPACGDRVCGDDGCGGTCGGCAPDETCAPNGVCMTPLVSCDAAEDGSPCSAIEGGICLMGSCQASACGDGFVNVATGEECDDSNLVPSDGCEPSCQFTCTSSANCADDGDPCNGLPSCVEATHMCETSAPLQLGSQCSAPNGVQGVCAAATGGSLFCKPATCGDGVNDSNEQCDDGNSVSGDGCEADCSFSCETDEQCDNGVFCDGPESCDAAHTCAPTTPPVCNDNSPCTEDRCDPTLDACVSPLIDRDGDGQASSALGQCGRDCNDDNPDVYTGHAETCADGLDNDCDGVVDNVNLSSWWPDCDSDGFASANRTAVLSCQMPNVSQNVCLTSNPGWTQRDPGVSADCCDQDDRVHKNQQAWFSKSDALNACGGWDFNCDGSASARWTQRAGSCVFDQTQDRCVVFGLAAGWDSKQLVPACGQAGIWAEGCDLVGTNCDFVYSPRDQECH